MEIEERNEREQRDAEDPFFDVEIVGRQPPHDPQRQRRHQHRQEVIGPPGDRKHGEPQPHDRRGERRMLVAPGQMTRPVEQLGHVGMQALAAFGDGAVDRPQHQIGRERGKHGALAPRRIGQRAVQAVDGQKQAHGPFVSIRSSPHADIGYTRCRQSKVRKSAKADLRWGTQLKHPTRLSKPSLDSRFRGNER